ncbi:MAG: hypothetical protein M3033_01695 [Acidobacteriota bacterium]|nr:hypothetical protein [Acidobacteriota bacterium]
MVEQYKVEKWIWTDADFEQMNWHDTRVYAVAFAADAYEIIFDIDYIFEWIHPTKGETYFRFWIAPATLVFENVYDIEMNLSETDFELDFVERKEPRKPKNAEFINRETEWLWLLEAQRGSIGFHSAGYKQYIRKNPVFGQAQSLEMDERGGISFHRGRLNENVSANK